MEKVKEVYHKGKPIPAIDEYIKLCPKIRRVYEDDDFIISILTGRNGEPIVRVSIFENGRWIDEKQIHKIDSLI